MTVSQQFVIEKLNLMEQYRTELADILRASDDEITTSPANRHAVERLFQLLVDAMIDINQHLIQELKLEVPNDLFSTFQIVGQQGILDSSFAKKLAPIVGVRNRLVHQYEKIEQVLFMENLRANFTDFKRYQDQIATYLNALGRSR